MFTMSAGDLRSIDVDTSQVKWTQAGDGHLVTAPLVIGNDVAVGSATGEVYLFDATTGTVLWSTTPWSPILAPDEHNAVTVTAMAESNGMLVVPATNTLVAYTREQRLDFGVDRRVRKSSASVRTVPPRSSRLRTTARAACS